MGAPLIQVSDVTTYANQINASNPVDSGMLGQLIPEVSDMVRRYCDREWWLGAYHESFYGKGAQSVRPRVAPIVGLTSVVLAKGSGNWQFSPVAVDSLGNPYPSAAGYWYDGRGIYLGGSWRFSDSRTPNVYVVYSGGYASLTGGPGVGTFTIASTTPLSNQTPVSLPPTLSTISAPGTAAAPALTPSPSGGTLASGTYYVIAVPLQWAFGFAVAAASLVTLTNSSGPNFNALLGPGTAQASAVVVGPTGSISCSIPSPVSGCVGYIWAISTVNGGPYTVLGLSFGTPDYGSIPNDIRMACIKEVMLRYSESARVGIKQSSEGNQQTAGYITSPIDPQVCGLLASWRRSWGGGF